jgi:hypothetical protein
LSGANRAPGRWWEKQCCGDIVIYKAYRQLEPAITGPAFKFGKLKNAAEAACTILFLKHYFASGEASFSTISISLRILVGNSRYIGYVAAR